VWHIDGIAPEERVIRSRTLKIGLSARIYHPGPNSVGIQSKTLQYLEQSVAHWVMSRDVLVFMVPSVDKDGIIHRSNIRISDYVRHLDGLVLQGGSDSGYRHPIAGLIRTPQRTDIR